MGDNAKYLYAGFIVLFTVACMESTWFLQSYQTPWYKQPHHKCPYIPCVWGEWSSWSTGVQLRVRNPFVPAHAHYSPYCKKPVCHGDSREVRPCNVTITNDEGCITCDNADSELECLEQSNYEPQLCEPNHPFCFRRVTYFRNRTEKTFAGCAVACDLDTGCRFDGQSGNRHCYFCGPLSPI